MTTVSNAIAERDNTPSGLIEQYRSDFATVLPSQINADQWVRMTMGVVRRNAQLANIAQRNPGSFLAAVLDAARLGLEIGETYHLVPFGNEVVGIADYTGLIELAYRAGAVASIKVEVVHASDDFHYEPGAMDRPEHKPDWFGDRGHMIGAYAYAVFKDGGVSQVVVRSKREIEQVRDGARGSNSKDSPWKNWPDRMWRKTVLRELMKFIPTSAEYRNEQARAQAAAAQVATAPHMPAGVSAAPADVLEGEVMPAGDAAWPEPAAVPNGGTDA
jgi:recombination protein RecT